MLEDIFYFKIVHIRRIKNHCLNISFTNYDISGQFSLTRTTANLLLRSLLGSSLGLGAFGRHGRAVEEK